MPTCSEATIHTDPGYTISYFFSKPTFIILLNTNIDVASLTSLFRLFNKFTPWITWIELHRSVKLVQN